MHYREIIFCDFDGTVTEIETLEAFLQLFLSEDLRALGQEMMAKGYSVKQGIKETMARIPSDDYRRHTDFFRQLPIREGFEAFLDYAHTVGIPVVILSGGIREMVETSMAPYRNKILDIWSGEVDLSGEYVRFYSPYESDTEVVSKVGIMRRYDCDRTICVGDSYTDLEMAAAADVVFARDRLASAMEKAGKKHFTFETFYDMINVLKQQEEALHAGN